jgi:hypothetical protein
VWKRKLTGTIFPIYLIYVLAPFAHRAAGQHLNPAPRACVECQTN